MQNIVPANFGSVLHLEPPDPGAGTNYNFSVSIPGRFIITAIVFNFTASAAAANRSIDLFVRSGTDEYIHAHTSRTSITAGQSINCYFYHGADVTTVPAWGFMILAFPQYVHLSSSFSFLTTTQNLQVADQYRDCEIWGQRWLEPTD